MAQLIDTSVIIELERRRLPFAALNGAVNPLPPALAAITASELLLGIERADTPLQRHQREQFVEAILAIVPVLRFDLDVARIHARLWATLLASGQTIGPHDMIIAATALAGGHSVLTQNLREFRRVPGLNVVQPNW